MKFHSIFILLRVLCASAVVFFSLSFPAIMSNGPYEIRSDIFDSTAGTTLFQSNGIYKNYHSPGQSTVVGDESNGIYYNMSGFLPEDAGDRASNSTSGLVYASIQTA